jgi:drug/metabolite transporter (DMT)-like permease
MEVVKPRSPSGIAKLTGVAFCLAGVVLIAFYIGPSLNPVNHHRALAAAHADGGDATKGTWIKGTFLMLLANVTWSLWIVLQAALLKEYPNKLLVTATQCVFSAVQCFVVALVAERDFSRWQLRFDVTLLAVLYTVRSFLFLFILILFLLSLNFKRVIDGMDVIDGFRGLW